MRSQTETNNSTSAPVGQINVIYTTCYNCQSDRYEFFDTEYGYNLVKCMNCGLLYVNPRPDDHYITKAAMLGVHTGKKEKAVTGRYHYYKVKYYLKILEDLYPAESLRKSGLCWLDVGCGFGEFIEALEIYTGKILAITGIDPNQIKVASAKKRNPIVSAVDLDQIEKSFDFISLLNVYSHLPDPVEFLTDIKKKLKENGELLLQTGDTSHLPKKHHPKPYSLPDHLSFANKNIIVGILERIGFEIIDVKIYRSSIYPKYYEIIKILKLFVKILIRRGESISYLYPKYPNTDMYIRSRLRS